jgi:hypothetical protein
VPLALGGEPLGAQEADEDDRQQARRKQLARVRSEPSCTHDATDPRPIGPGPDTPFGQSLL